MTSSSHHAACTGGLLCRCHGASCTDLKLLVCSLHDTCREGSYLLCRYRLGPQPHDLGGQRALDFVLDNPTLQPFNRTLLIDISLLSVRKRL